VIVIKYLTIAAHKQQSNQTFNEMTVME